MKNVAFLLLLALAISACKKDPETHVQPDPVIPEDGSHAILSKYLNLPETPFSYAKPTFEGSSVKQPNRYVATLGRVLFYDKRLSANNTVSCASCHQQEFAFSDNVAFSEGFEGKLTARNSPGLGSVLNFQVSYQGNTFFNLVPQNFFWDERAFDISEQSTETLQNPIEMGSDIEALGSELMQEEFYQVLFQQAFPNEPHVPVKRKILLALEEFINAMFSANSRFDQGLLAAGSPQKPFPTFTSNENNGKKIYLKHCASCHGDAMQSVALASACNGLDEVYADRGIGAVNNNPYQDGAFKVPMLRNVALTAPYMHDGRFKTLEEVVEHYNSGIQNHPNLHQILKDYDAPRRLNLTESEKKDLVRFLKMLTDMSTLEHERFSDPFK